MIRYAVVAGALVALAFTLPGAWRAAAPVVALLAVAWLDRRLLRDLRRPGLWLLLAALAVGPALVVGPFDDRWLGIRYHRELLLQGGTLVARGVTVTTALLLLGRGVSPAAIQRAFTHVGLRDLGLATAVAIDLLPVTRRALLRTIVALRLRGGLGRRLPWNLGRLIVAVVVQTIRLSEQVAEALLLRRATLDEPAEPAEGSPPPAPPPGAPPAG